MEYKSLYTYLGHGAGSKLGKEVATKASELGLKLEKVEVDKTLSPSGFVYSYPVDFLDEYFKEKEHHLALENRMEALERRVSWLENKHTNTPPDDLPF
tara:strand:+ start:27 stop:320 length:294 start_codon:yes stop_codon:yes gene_type:complete